MDYNNTGAMRSPFSPRIRQSISGRRPIGSSGTKNQSKFQSQEDLGGEVIYKTPSMTIETYGPPLPVMVTEALTFGSGDVSVRLSTCGWCWLVCGRRVLAWPGCTNPSDGGPAATGPQAVRELTLPQTDLAHKADLVMLFYEDDAQMPSCIGVSPEGVVRYWANVGQEGVYVDVSCELAGQECERLTEPRPRAAPAPAPLDLVLATTTCTLVLLAPTVVDGRNTITCKTLRPPSGWLGGIGRRVSLLFFGSMPAHADTKLVGVVTTRAYTALVAGGGAGPVLQLWAAGVSEHALRRALLDALDARAPGLQLAALDAAADGDQLVLLLGVGARAGDLRHVIAHLAVQPPDAPRVVAVRAVPSAGAPARLAGPAAVLGPAGVARVGADLPERPDAPDSLLAALGGRAPLLFSAKHGCVRLRAEPAARAGAAPAPGDAGEGGLALFEIDPRAVRPLAGDAASRLKTAFLFHVRREAAAAAELLQWAAPAAGVDDALDRAVLAVAAEMLDDAPAGDPRWAPAQGAPAVIALGRSTQLQVSAQLQDKRRAFTLFVEFLRAHQLWQRLQRVTFEGEVVPTTDALGALGERLAAALALRQLHQQPPDEQLVEAAVQQVAAEDAEEEAGAALPAADVVFRRVTRVLRVLERLAAAPHRPPALLRQLQCVTHVAREVQRARAAWGGAAGGAARGALAAGGALAALHARALAAGGALAALHARALAAGGAPDVLDAAAALADALLEEARRDPAHQALHRDVIRAYVEAGHAERAAVLAEKFHSLDALVALCVERGQLDRLCRYLDAHGDAGAAAALDGVRGARAARLLRALGERRGALPPALAAWARAPDRAAPRALLARDWPGAGAALTRAACTERRRLSRARTLCSLATLCGAAGGGVAADAARLLWLCGAHSALPPAVAARAEPDRLYAPEDLVQMYVECESEALSEYDYKQALELAEAGEAGRREALRLRVWCACVQRGDELFLRLADLVQLAGGGVPAADELLAAPALAARAADASFRYSLQFACESAAH